jgi:nucleotide-binding universal stress UspA family protein
MRRPDNNSKGLQSRLNSLFQRLLESFHRTDDQPVDDELEAEHQVGLGNQEVQQSSEDSQAHGSAARMRKLLVAVDASQHSLIAMETAADLAASLKAELRGLFVEDIDLLRIAGLPVVREVQYPCGTAGYIDQARMERQLRAQAAQARQAIASVCQKRRIRWSFEVVRGNVRSEILAAATEADLLILGRVSRPLIRRLSIGSTALAAIQDSTTSVLLTQVDRKIRSPVVTFFHDSPCGQRALAIAIHLAQKTGGVLTILLLDEAAEQAARQSIRTQASDLLRRSKLIVRYRLLQDSGLATISQAVESEASGVVILSECLFPPDDIRALIENLERPAILIR